MSNATRATDNSRECTHLRRVAVVVLVAAPARWDAAHFLVTGFQCAHKPPANCHRRLVHIVVEESKLRVVADVQAVLLASD